MEDFRNFLFIVWKHLRLPDPTPVQYDIAHFLQHGPRRLVVEAFRGVGKTWITVAFVVWLLYCNPQLNVLVVSASKQHADNFSTFALRLIYEMDILAHLRPKEGQRSSKIAFDVGPARASQAPSIKSVGITGQVTGSRADVIVADDLEIPNNSATQAMRDRLSELVKEFDAVLKPDSVLPSGSRILYLGTPQCEMSLYNVLPQRGYVVRIWPARFPHEDKRAKYGLRLAPFISDALDADPELVGHPTDSRRFADDDLVERELSYGRSGFALQFMLDTSLSDAERYPLKVSDLIVMSLNPGKAPAEIIWASSPDLIVNDLPNVAMAGDFFYRPMHVDRDQWVEYTGSVMFIDPSGRGKDETGYAVVKMLHGMMFATAVGGMKGGYEEKDLFKLLDVARLQRVNKIIVEPNFGGGMFAQLLRAAAQKRYPVTIEDSEWSTSSKEARIIDTLEPVMNQHRLVMALDVIDADYRSTEAYPAEEVNEYRLIYQMTRITRDKGALSHDDRLDALAGAVQYWVDHLSRNVQVAQKDHQEALFQADLDRFMQSVVGGKGSSRANQWTHIGPRRR